MNHPDKPSVLENALADIARGEVESASTRISADYPFDPVVPRKRRWTRRRALSIFRGGADSDENLVTTSIMMWNNPKDSQALIQTAEGHYVACL